MTLPAILKKSIPVYAGDDFSIPLTFLESNGQPTDLTAWGEWAAWAAIRGVKVAELEVAVASANELILRLTATKTRELYEVLGEPGGSFTLDFDVQGKSAGITTTWVRGKLIVTDDITKEL